MNEWSELSQSCMMSVTYLMDKIFVQFHKTFIKLTSSIAIVKYKLQLHPYFHPFWKNSFFQQEKLIWTLWICPIMKTEWVHCPVCQWLWPKHMMIHPALVIHFPNLKKGTAGSWWIGGANNVLSNRMFIEYLH